MEQFTNNIIVAGHYGSGKTNFSLNLAKSLKKKGHEVILADLDIVNPYFRTADFGTWAEEEKIELLLPPFANSNVDLPIVSGGVASSICSDKTLILDVGGDAAGAIALGQYTSQLHQAKYSMCYVVNQYRPMTDTVDKALEILSEIEGTSRLTADFLINNSNLGHSTTEQDILASMSYANEIATKGQIKLLCTTVKEELCKGLQSIENLFPVSIYVKAPWN